LGHAHGQTRVHSGLVTGTSQVLFWSGHCHRYGRTSHASCELGAPRNEVGGWSGGGTWLGTFGRIMSSRKDKDGMYAVEDILQILNYRLSGNANAANCGYPATSQSFTLDPGSTDWGKNGEREKTRENLRRSFGPRCRSKCWDAQVSSDRPALTVFGPGVVFRRVDSVAAAHRRCRL